MVSRELECESLFEKSAERLAAEEWPGLAVDDDAMDFLRQRLLPATEHRERAQRVAGRKGDSAAHRARARPLDEDADERGSDEPPP